MTPCLANFYWLLGLSDAASELIRAMARIGLI